jgi:hypothetical protein
MEDIKQIKRKRGQRGRGVAIKHGGYALLTGGPIPKKRAYVGKYLTAIREGFCQDLGGEPGMSTSEIVLLDKLIVALGITRLIEEYVKERGVIDNPQGFLNPSLSKGYISYCNQVRLTTQLLQDAVKERAKGQQPGDQAKREEYLTSFSRQDDDNADKGDMPVKALPPVDIKREGD